MQLSPSWCHLGSSIVKLCNCLSSTLLVLFLVLSRIWKFTLDIFSNIENLIGKGGSSKVFKGCLNNGDKVAIKLSKLNTNSSRDFLREVEIMTKLKHKRIVPLIGVCVEANSLISIYSYISRGSLEENLNCKNSTKWSEFNNLSLTVLLKLIECLIFLFLLFINYR